MNIGIYVDSLDNAQHLEHIANFVNNTIRNKEVRDCSIFYDDVGYIPFKINCGIFNSTDIWNFSGNLIVTSLNTINKAVNIVNNIDMYYYNGWEESYKVLDLLFALENKMHVICQNEIGANKFYRITGKHPVGITNNYENVINIIKENSDEYSRNYKNVCRA
jgi:hypothetical protein